MSSLLLIDKKAIEGKTIVSLEGRIGTDNFMDLDAALQELDYSNLDLILDFSKVEYITSAGLRTLLIARKKLAEDKMTIIHANEAVKNVFEVSGFSSFIKVETDNDAEAPGDDPSFKQMLAYRVKTSPDKEVFFLGDKAYTWLDVDRTSQIIANDLAKLGVKKGSHVAVLSNNSINWISTFFAIQKLGAIIILLNFSLKPEEVRMFAEIGDITHLCFGDMSAKTDREAFAAEVKMNGSLIRETYDINSSIDFRTRYNELPALEGLFQEEYDPDDPSVMIFTSGTTGKPKGVLSSSHDRITNCKIMAREMRVTQADRICLFLPLCHIFGFGTGLSVALLLNLPLYMPRSTSDADIIDTIYKNGCTLFNSVPTKIISIVQSEFFSNEKLATLRCSMIGGAAISAAQLSELQKKLPQVHFMPIYGMSEISPISLVRYEDTPDHIVNTVGKPVMEVHVETRNPSTGAVCAPGEEGEICVKSDTSLLCYYKLDIEKQAIDGEGWIPTGDLGILCEDGYLKITGRIKDLIIRGGENIAPKEIESAITEVDGIYDVKVVGVPDELFGEIVAAAVVMKSGATFNRNDIESVIRSKLANFKIPAHYVLYDAFPLLANGKVNMLEIKKDVANKVKAGEAQ